MDTTVQERHASARDRLSRIAREYPTALDTEDVVTCVLIDHLRTSTMHPDVLVRRAIRVAERMEEAGV